MGQTSVYSSCNSQSTDSFHSAKDTIEEDLGTFQFPKKLNFENFPKLNFYSILATEDEEQKLLRRFSNQLDSPERRGTFAQRLQDALKRESTATGTSSNNSSSESSYAVGSSVTGSHAEDQNIKYVFLI